MNKVYIEHANPDYRLMFRELGFTVTDQERAELVCFTGGADVTPSYYGEPNHSSYNDEYRDAKEERLFHHCLERGIPMVGICRGGQFLNVMSGGKMYQNVTQHGFPHFLVDNITGETVYVTSTHHQMMLPSNEGAIIAMSRGVNSQREWFENQVFKRDVSEEGIEVVFYEHTKCLCFQPHPEFDGYQEMRNYFHSLIQRYLKV